MGGTKSPTVISQQLVTELTEVIPNAAPRSSPHWTTSPHNTNPARSPQRLSQIANRPSRIARACREQRDSRFDFTHRFAPPARLSRPVTRGSRCRSIRCVAVKAQRRVQCGATIPRPVERVRRTRAHDCHEDRAAAPSASEDMPALAVPNRARSRVGRCPWLASLGLAGSVVSHKKPVADGASARR
jgi:hypothetical protein